MRTIYRVYVPGEIPSNLKEKISALHATGILKGENKDPLLCNRDLDLFPGKESKSKITESKNKE